MEKKQTPPQTKGPTTRFFEGDQYAARMVDEESRTIEGYAIVFNQESRLLGGWFIERILPEAVQGATDGIDLRSEYNHESNFLLGRASSGTATFTVDEIGYKYRVQVPRTYYGDTVLELAKRGDLKGASFQFITADNGDEWETVTRNGQPVRLRTVTKMEAILEMGPVNEPAYFGTTAEMKSFDHERRSFENWKQKTEPKNNNRDARTLAAIIAEVEAI